MLNGASLGLVLALALAVPGDASATENEDGCARIDTALAAADAATSRSAHRRHLIEAAEAASECPERRHDTFMAVARRFRTDGDDTARRYFEDGVAAAPDDAGAAVEVGDYFRVMRGPLQPLFPESESYYFLAERALERGGGSADVQARLTRSLAALYERDGVPVLHRRDVPGLGDRDPERPFAFFSSQLQVGRLLDVVGEADAVRDLTSSALLAGIRQIPPRPLTVSELRALVHPRTLVETLDRLRLRYESMPVLDAWFVAGNANDAQVTRFDRPGEFNDVETRAAGLGLERTFDVSPVADVGVRIDLSRGDRWGLIEALPHARERVDVLALSGVFSRFVGTSKLSLEVHAFFADIDQKVRNPIERGQEIVAATLRYQRYTSTTFAHLFDLRTSEAFAGVALGQERYGDVNVDRDDYFVGVAARGLPPDERFDVIVQPTLFRTGRDGHESDGAPAAPLRHSQYRTAITLLYRLHDYENEVRLDAMPGIGPAHLVFLHLVVPVAHDLAVSGPDAFDGIQTGLELVAKVIGVLSTGDRFTVPTVLATLGYGYARYPHLDDKDAHIARLSVGLGF